MIFAATALLASIFSLASAHAEFVLGKSLTNSPGVTHVTDEPSVTVTMGLKMAPTNELGDSVKWWDRREAGWRRWMSAREKFPRATSSSIEIYLSALAEGFTKVIPWLPLPRFHFYVADTLNPSLWPVGGGFFVIHAGLLRHLRDERQFAFLIALELAHETLGHNMVPIRAGDIKWEPGSWREGDYDGWPVEFWAFMVGHDPIDRGGFTYTLQQESDALELVYRFFAANVWEYDGINRLLSDLLPQLNVIPGSSSLARLHTNLALAIRLPHDRPKCPITPVDSVVNRATYAQAEVEIERSSVQHYPWMLELVPYREFVTQRTINIAQVREQYNEHSDVRTEKILTATRQTRKTSLASELDEFVERNDELIARDKLVTAKLARIYLRGSVLLSHHRWADAIASAQEGLKIDSSAEPFHWQRALARQQLSQFNKCIAEMPLEWRYFDHRRELLIVQCSFLEGRYTDAAKLALEYRRRFPFDIEGAFWETLVEIRLNRSLAKHIEEIETFWGDRPMVRALKIFYYGYLGKQSEAEAAITLNTDITYLPQEWGMLEFAQAWLRDTFNPIAGDDRADKLRQLAELQWPLSRLVKYNLPRDTIQNR